jgi:hypothetical protein
MAAAKAKFITETIPKRLMEAEKYFISKPTERTNVV